MLKNIKKKLNSAIKDGIQITKFSPVHSPTLDNLDDSELGIPPEINISAGSELLMKYEDAWISTYEANKANIEVAANITDTIDRLQLRMKARQVNINDLMVCLAGLPAIGASLKDSLNKFNEIEELGLAAEEKLVDLWNLCQMLDKQDNIMKQNLVLKQKEMEELEAQQKREATEKRLQIKLEEKRLERMQQERQAAFDEAFRGDMEEYKQTGSVSKIDLKSTRVLTLEEIDLETDGTDALEDFLNE